MRKIITAALFTVMTVAGCGSVSASVQAPASPTSHYNLITPRLTKTVHVHNAGVMTDYRNKFIVPLKNGILTESARPTGPGWKIADQPDGSFQFLYGSEALGINIRNQAVLVKDSNAADMFTVGYGPSSTCVLGIADGSGYTLDVAKNGTVIWNKGANSRSDFKLQSNLNCTKRPLPGQ